MDMTHASLPSWVLVIAWAGLLSSLAVAVRTGGLRSLIDIAARHAFLGTLVALLALWQLRAVTPVGPGLHVLGATLLVLMHGWRAATVGLVAVLAAHTANGAGDWPALGFNGLTMVVIPVAVSHIAMRAVARSLPAQPFGYILLSGFAGAGLAMAASLAVTSALLLGLARLDATQLFDQFTRASMLLVFPEAFLTGAVVAWLAMFYPASLCSWTPPWERPPDRDRR